MAEKVNDDDDYDDEADDVGMLDDFEDVEDSPIVFKDSSAARRRVEQLQEEKALERLLNGDYDDWG